MTDMPQGAQGMDPVQLGLSPGMTVEVLTPENRQVFLGKVESVKDGAVVVRDNRWNEVPQVMYNREMRLSFKHDGETTMVRGKICGCSNEIWKLDQLESVFTKDQRTAFRQSISTSIPAKCYRRSPRGDPEKEGIDCDVVDVSSGGLMFSSLGSFEIGDRLILLDVRLVGSMESFSFSCQVRREVHTEDGIRYGCQFERMSDRDRDRLLQAIFVIQREEIRIQKEKGRF